MIKHLYSSVFLWLFLPTAYCLLPTGSCEAQNNDVMKYAHQVVDTLASPSMHGRGYILKGDSLAADYLRKEFGKMGLSAIGRSFYQRLCFPVNTFPKVNYNIYYRENKYNGLFTRKKLYRGHLEDPYFLIAPSSPSIKGKFNVITIDSLQLKNEQDLFLLQNKKFNGEFLLADSLSLKDKKNKKLFESLIGNPPSGISGVLVYNNPPGGKNALMWDAAQTQMKYPIIEIGSLDYIEKIKIEIDAELIPNYQSKNVLCYIKGSQYPDSFIVFSAHYDHLGMMGKDVYFPGANDNASGCAMLLNLAKYYSQHPPKYSIAFMAFGGEEVGLLGSKYYVEHPLFPLKQIKFLINMDIMGTGDEGIKVVNATEHKKEFDELVKINDEKKLLPSVQPRGKAAISDHYFFEEAGVKTFFIYTLGGIKAYHDIYDRPETLPLTKFEETFKLLTDFSEYLQK
jgi:hypothetical protein